MKIALALCLVVALCCTAKAQSAWDKRMLVCESAAQARQLVEHTGGSDNSSISGTGCTERYADYDDAGVVDTLHANGRFFKIIAVTLTVAYDERGLTQTVQYSIVYGPKPMFLF